jgi:ankyrin repeat protein
MLKSIFLLFDWTPALNPEILKPLRTQVGKGLTVLHAAAAQKEAAVLVPLLGSNAPVNRRSLAGDTPLLIAAATGHAEVVQALLLVEKSDLDVQNKAGDTALIAASRGGYTAICHMLLGAGANTGLRNTSGVTAGDVALGRGFASIVKELAGKS